MTVISPHLRRWLLAGLAALALLAVPGLVGGQEMQFHAVLSGDQEVPPVTTDATGTFTLTFNEATGTVDWALSVPAITQATAAHIHIGAVGVNGPIVIDLWGAPAGAPAGSIDVSGSATAADLVGPLAGDPLGFVEALGAGELYVNVHTVAHPPGEIRGQLEPGPLPAEAPAPPAAPPPPAPTGSAGLAGSQGSTAGSVIALLTLAVATLAGARLLSARAARRSVR